MKKPLAVSLVSLATLSLSTILGAVDLSPAEKPGVGTLRSVMSAQAYHQKTYPAVGYACHVETLVNANALSADLAGGKAFNGYVLKVECPQTSTPQRAFRASAVPAAGAQGKAFCADQGGLIRFAADGTAKTCFEAGAQLNPDMAAVGTIRSIISAQAHHQKAFPATGYACDIETLVKANALSAALSAGKPFNGYVFTVDCPKPEKPQPTYRASAVPAPGTEGKAFCTDDPHVIRASPDGTAETCFGDGSPIK